MKGDRSEIGVIIDCLSRLDEARRGNRLMTVTEGSQLIVEAYRAALVLRGKLDDEGNK